MPPENSNLRSPTVMPDSAPFWEACRQGCLRLPTCDECGKPHLPPGPVCPHCLHDQLSWKQASGYGTVSSWVVYRKAFSQRFQDRVPYNACLIELDEGPRLYSTIKNAGDIGIRIGDRVVADFEWIDEAVRIPVFTLLSGDIS